MADFKTDYLNVIDSVAEIKYGIDIRFMKEIDKQCDGKNNCVAKLNKDDQAKYNEQKNNLKHAEERLIGEFHIPDCTNTAPTIQNVKAALDNLRRDSAANNKPTQQVIDKLTDHLTKIEEKFGIRDKSYKNISDYLNIGDYWAAAKEFFGNKADKVEATINTDTNMVVVRSYTKTSLEVRKIPLDDSEDSREFGLAYGGHYGGQVIVSSLTPQLKK
jgi:hypothetical protein